MQTLRYLAEAVIFACTLTFGALGVAIFWALITSHITLCTSPF